MREILFRGKRVDNSEWVESENLIRRKDWDGKTWKYRTFVQDGDSCNRTPLISNFVEVITETVGQYIGKKDCKDNRIFSGDTLNVKLHGAETHLEWQDAEVRWCGEGCGFGLYINEKSSGHYGFVAFNSEHLLGYEIIATIHDKEQSK